MASTYLTQTISSSTGKIFTLSMWVKKVKTDASGMLFHLSSDSGNTDYLDFAIKSNNQLDVQLRNGSSTTYYRKRLNRLFRDTNAWYHLVWRFDSTNSTADDRWILYVNGERATDIDLNGTPSQVSSDYVTPLNRNGATLQIGNAIGGSMYFDGCLSHVHFCDGYSYGADSFGETDSTTGEWKINTSPSVSYGTNGFFIFKDDNAVTDRSGQGNNFTLGGGTLTKTEDCPSNVFATLNPLHPSLNTSRAFSNGNTYVALGGTARVPEVSTIGMTSGKFYAEMKDISGSGGASIMGITGQMRRAGDTDWLGSKIYDYSYYGSAGDKANNASETSYGNSFTDGDIIGVAVDLDNLKIYFSKNGVWQNSGDPTSGATGTGAAFTITAPSSTVDGAYFFACSDDNAFAERRMAWNFGNGYFQTTAVASAGTNASGIGIFEYDVPTGYTALSTKGLNE